MKSELKDFAFRQMSSRLVYIKDADDIGEKKPAFYVIMNSLLPNKYESGYSVGNPDFGFIKERFTRYKGIKEYLENKLGKEVRLEKNG